MDHMDGVHENSDRFEFQPIAFAPPSAVSLSEPLQRFALITGIIILFTSSFDIFLVVHAGGNYRLCQIILLPIIALACVKVSGRPAIPVLGSLAVCIWFLFQVAFIPVTNFWPKTVGYCLWLLLNLGMMFSFVQLFNDNPRNLRTLLRWYLYSFGFVAACGIIQFALPILGFPDILVAEWWIPGLVPRVNAFSYEPSYFASYLLIGFVLISSLKRAKSPLLSARALFGLYCLVALGVIISSSRLGVVFLTAEVVLSQAKPWLQFLRDLGKRRILRSRVRAMIASCLLLGCIGGVLGCGVAVLRGNPLLLILLLNGTGVGDTAAHSVRERENAFRETLAVIAEHPFIGRSLGGISAAIANDHGSTIRSFEDAKTVEGMSVFAEALAASGLIGFAPFVCFVVVTIHKPLKLARSAPHFESSLLYGLVRSLLFAWAILQFNQNVLRTYLWTHLAILATVYAASSRALRCESSGVGDD